MMAETVVGSRVARSDPIGLEAMRVARGDSPEGSQFNRGRLVTSTSNFRNQVRGGSYSALSYAIGGFRRREVRGSNLSSVVSALNERQLIAVTC